MQAKTRPLPCLALLLALCARLAWGADASFDDPANDQVLAALAALGDEWRAENPYRGDARAIAAGQTLYAAHCARCHGEDASGRGPAADLRVLGRYCRRIADEDLRRRCARDADDYFRRSVLFGKVRLGIVHMPPWKDVLSQEAVWALRSFVGTRDK